MLTVWNRCAFAVLVVLFPIAAFADLTGTLTVPASSSVSLDTGTVVMSGGDLRWSGTSLSPQVNAKAVNATALSATFSGPAGYAALNQTILQAAFQAGVGSSSPLNGLAVNTVIGALSNGGNFAKLLVTAVSTASITLQYTTYGPSGSGGGGAPTITMVQNNYSYLVPGLPNYGIAPGTLFIIKGTNLASTTTVSQLQSSAAPGIPLSLNGASISVTVGGVTTHPAMYYAIATQIAAVLPSGTPTGTGTITVTYNSTASNAASILVVPSALGLDTYYGSGTGLGVATDLSYNVFNYTNAAKPGQNIILWGSGLGADTSDSDTTYTTSPHAVNVPLTIYIGGIAVTPGYAGSAGFPGLNQINVTIPSSVQPGCNVSVVGVSGSVASNFVALPISPSGGVCTDPLLGTNGSTIGTLSGKSSYNQGVVALIQGTNPSRPTLETSASGIFSVSQGSSSSSTNQSIGSCTVTSLAAGGTPTTPTYLDAGNLSITGPAGTQQLTQLSIPGSGLTGLYSLALPASFIPSTGGSFTFTGGGGAKVGAFMTSFSYANPMSWTNQSAGASVTRTQGLNVTWTGGDANSYLSIYGISGSAFAIASFTCLAPVSAGQFTVPTYVLLALPAGSGNLSVGNFAIPQSFTASGLDYGIVLVGTTYTVNSTYQ
jgi:uncharacterized protein (TIGR03437 family)